MTAAVLDASALLALILGEPGGDKVQRLLTDCAVTAVNLGEVIGHFAGIGASEADIRLMLDPLPFVRVALDEELAFIAGLMLPATRPPAHHLATARAWRSAASLESEPLQRIARGSASEGLSGSRSS